MRALAAIAAGVMFATSVQAAPVTLDPDQMRQVGFVALTSDQPGKALEIAAALLRRDPQDVSALILKSRALRDLGRYTDARATAAQAWAGARTEAQRYGAALAMAQALASEGARTRAQFWLRRAVQASPTPLARQIAERDFDYVRARNPLSFSLQVSLAPSSNINGGSSNTATELLGLPFLLSGDARALSGTEATLGLTLRWRLPVTPTARTEYRLSVLDRHYWLSSEARRQAPEATGGDYDYAAVELGWSRRITPQTGPLNYSLGAALGRNWYGHSPLSVYLRAEAAVDGPLTPRTAWQLQAYSEQQWRDDAARNSARILGLSAGIIRGLADGGQIGLALGASDTASKAISIDHRAVSARIDWSLGRPVAGIGLAGDLGVERREYATFPFTTDGRQDLRLSADLSMTFGKIEYLGFAPVLTLSAAQTWSNLGLYDSREAGVSLGVRSSF